MPDPTAADPGPDPVPTPVPISRRLHVTGASGSGTTTLARAVAAVWAVPHADSDDYYWEPTDPPYTTPREPATRVELMRRVFVPRPAWVLSGSLMGWGDPLVAEFDAVVMLHLDPTVRLARLAERERQRYGAAIEPGGERHEAHLEFLAWAAQYDDPTFTGRSLARHEAWLDALPCPVLRVEGGGGVDELLAAVFAGLRRLDAAAH